MTGVVPSSAFIPDELYKTITAYVPIPCVDLVPIRQGRKELEVLLIKRNIEPERGKWCVVGGRVVGGREVKPETLAGAISRQAQREFGVEIRVIEPWGPNHPVAVFDDPKCDPAKWPIIMVYPVEIVGGEIQSGPESSEVCWFPGTVLPDVMGFTHRAEVDAALSAVRNKDVFSEAPDSS